MLKVSSQGPIFHWISYGCIPLCLLLPFLLLSPLKYNYTGILNSEFRWIMIFPFVAFFLLAFLIYWLEKKFSFFSWKVLYWFTFSFCLFSIFVPYPEKEGLLSSLHVFLSFSSLFLVHLLLLPILLINKNILRFYITGFFTAFLITCLSASVNGLAELIYGVILSLSLGFSF